MFKLIIVEDEHLIRKWLEIAVDYSALGIQVVGTASHGQEGMKLIQEKEPHICLNRHHNAKKPCNMEQLISYPSQLIPRN
ncbi:DNA-binding response regulator [Streptococcus pneumoniae]|uniref:response regulator n=1 Tax=Streptococcus pneumoniae TaxID=1313 RepID=UPI000768F2EB|nr:response regulator [Streptococcus pneumoniae]CZC55782.1 DNA-binding response regulator [Streptococcus pneumoniae]